MDASQTLDIQKCLDYHFNLPEKNDGLYHGRLGLSCCYILLSQYNRTEENYHTGVSLYQEVISGLENTRDAGVSDGLLGIGLGINYLYLNKLMEIEIDKELFDFDDFFYKSVTLQKPACFAFENGTLGIAYYFYQRMFSQNKHQAAYRYLLHRECLILLTTEFKNFLISEKGLLKLSPRSMSNEQLVEITQSFIFLFRIWKLKYCPGIVAGLLRDIRDFINENFDILENDRKRLILLYSYILIGVETNNTVMIQKSGEWFMKIDKKNISSSPDILFYTKINNLLGYPYGNIPIRPNTLFDAFILLDGMNTATGKQCMSWLNLWGF